MSTRSVLYENLSERYYLVLKHILGQNQVINSWFVKWRIQELTDGGGGGADFSKKLYTTQLALICSEGV